MADKTVEKTIHEGLLALLQEDAAELAVAGRTPVVFDYLPDHSFTQKELPSIHVEAPDMTDCMPWGNEYERQTFNVTFVLLDGCGVKPGDEQAAKDRLTLLWAKMRAVFRKPKNANLGVPELHVYASEVEWVVGETLPLGNNLLGKALSLTLRALVERGKFFTV